MQVSMVLNEVLRLYPPVTSLFRHTMRKTNIGGMSIPAGVDFVLPTLLLRIRRGRENREKRERKQREEGEKAETESEQ